MARRLVIILLSFVLLVETVSPSANLADFSHISDIWTHFEEHSREHPGITFIEFISLHYLDSDHIKQQSLSHQKLPFSKRLQHYNFLLQMVPDGARVYTPSRSLVMTISAVIYSGGSVPSVAMSVWQPPKI
jgi:hypothetical protein